ncbi:DoxX family protein [Algivirga pacifica]|uniref:DoxX-like family protein n=1 Tax=Algivirga pacifica TaxID=1162670 RepID=A0ABP9D823_9BACT
MKRDKIIFYAVTGLLSAMMLMSAGMYIFNYEHISAEFTRMGFPLWIVYPLAVAKVLGVAAILSGLVKELKYMAYTGFFFNFVLAAVAHLQTNDGEFGGAVVALVLLGVSYFFDQKVQKEATKASLASA